MKKSTINLIRCLIQVALGCLFIYFDTDLLSVASFVFGFVAANSFRDYLVEENKEYKAKKRI